MKTKFTFFTQVLLPLLLVFNASAAFAESRRALDESDIDVELYQNEIRDRFKSLGLTVSHIQLQPHKMNGSLAQLRSTIRQSVKKILTEQEAQSNPQAEWQFILTGGVQVEGLTGWIQCYAYINVNYHNPRQINGILFSFRHLILDSVHIGDNQTLATLVAQRIEKVRPESVQRIEIRDPDWTKSPYAPVSWAFDRFLHFRDYLMGATANQHVERTFRKLGTVDLVLPNGRTKIIDLELRVFQSDEDANLSKAITVMVNLESLKEPVGIKRIDD